MALRGGPPGLSRRHDGSEAGTKAETRTERGLVTRSLPPPAVPVDGGASRPSDVETTRPLELTSRSLDAELVERHRYGDPQAFEQIYERFSLLVYNLALRMSGDPGEAQDLSQEIFLRVYRGLARFRGRSSLKTWIYRIGINQCRSRLGRRRLHLVSLTAADGQDLDLTDPQRDPEQVALAGDAGRLLAVALPKMDRVFREAVVLRDLEGLSYQEVSGVLRIPIGTVRSRIARGREQLRRILESTMSLEKGQ